MRLHCPNCLCELEVIAERTTVEVTCPSCGSHVDVSSSLETATYLPPKLGFLGPFELIEHIGRGHYGDVYKANDSRLSRMVAIKVPRTAELGLKERDVFFREARAAAQLRHPNIVTVHEVGTSGETVYIASEFIDGVNLGDLIDEHRLDPRRAAHIAARVAEALHHAHAQDVIHRDLKPRNIMLDAEGEPHLLDFGLAKQSTTEFTLTTAGNILGTPAYMAPEQARGDAGSADCRTDVYSLGVMLYEMLTGQRPFRGQVRGLIYQILNEDPRPPRQMVADIPRDMETICLKAMAKRPEDRYHTAAALADDLVRFLAGAPIQARPLPLVERAWRWGRKNPALAIAGAVAAVAVVLLVVQWSRGPGVVGTATASGDAPLPDILSGHQEPPSPNFAHNVAIVTEPAGASVVCYLLDWETGRPDFRTRLAAPAPTPTELNLTSGMYLVVVHNQDGFHEVLRTVPRYPSEKFGPYAHVRFIWDVPRNLVQWPAIKLFPHSLPDEDLVRSEGTASFEFDLTAVGGGNEQWRVPPFQVESTELSIAKYQRFDRLKAVHRERAANLAAGDLQWDQALNYAETRGLRLPDLLECEFLATNGGILRYPWGDDPPAADNWDFERPVDTLTRDRLSTTPPTLGLASGVLEWTATRTLVGQGTDTRPGFRFVVRGGPPGLIAPVVACGPWASVNQHTTHRGLGVRCARSPKPRLAAEDFLTRLP